MDKRIIITIARQYGSGGREIGQRLSELLGIPLYDKELIKDAASRGNLDEDVITRADESAANSLLYTLAMGSNPMGTAAHFGYKMPLNDRLFILQSEVIKDYAKEGSCIIIGRCADYVLRDDPDVFRIFVYGNTECKRQRIMQRHPEIKESHIIDTMTKTDKRRSSYYNFYTGNKWGRFEHYDMLVNSSTLGISETAQMIYGAILKKLSLEN